VIEAELAPDRAPKALFLGEGPNSARYLEGVLQTGFQVTRVFNGQPLADAPEVAERLDDFDLFLLSDYGAANLSPELQDKIVRCVERGAAGLLMIGGWASFSGPRAGWRGTRLAELLPVDCLAEDDRHNSPLGTVLVARREPHPAIRSIQAAEPCAVMGFNRVNARPEAHVLLHGYQLRTERERAQPHLTLAATMTGARVARGFVRAPVRPILDRVNTPMLAVWDWGRGRVGAFAPDVSPHWAGGLLDWGVRRVKLPTGAEIGHLYGAFLLDLCNWLSEKSATRP
jgi:uncharacterized membrane protein